MKKQILYLDGWRGLAIGSLLIGHFFPVPGVNMGAVGVALFFVLSGLLMAQVLFIQKTPFATFYKRRVSRVFPSVAVYLALITCIFLFAGIEVVPRELIAAGTFTNNYFVTTEWKMPFGHIWSLSVEEHSYVILSLAAWWCRAKKVEGAHTVAAVLLVIIAAIGIYSLMPGAAPSSFSLRTEVASFGIFVSAFWFLVLAGRKAFPSGRWVAPVALAIGVLCHWWSIPTGVRVIVGYGALAISINAMPSAYGLFVRLLEMPLILRLGRYSFSLYLWQQPYYQLVRHFGMHPAIGLGLALLTGWVAYTLLENPARLYLNRKWAANPLAAPDQKPLELIK